jgi:hypothetical protein
LVGLKKDMQAQREQPRRWSDVEQAKLEKARDWIYIKNKQVNSVRVEDLLYGDSLVPTRVNLLHCLFAAFQGGFTFEP